jgi:hypothetical protein
MDNQNMPRVTEQVDERDAARYRWLMDNQWCVEWNDSFYDRSSHGPNWTATNAIDAAIAASAAQEKKP